MDDMAWHGSEVIYMYVCMVEVETGILCITCCMCYEDMKSKD